MDRDDPVLQALRRYIRAELDGHKFYVTAAERTTDARGQEMFTSLASDEIDHAKKLATEYEHVLKTGNWLSLQQVSSMDSTVDLTQASVFAEGQTSIIPQIGPDTTDLDALRLGIEMEKASYEAYAEAASQTPSQAARGVFEFLMNEEQRHLDLLRNSYDYLARTDSWFEELEKPIYEG